MPHFDLRFPIPSEKERTLILKKVTRFCLLSKGHRSIILSWSGKNKSQQYWENGISYYPWTSSFAFKVLLVWLTIFKNFSFLQF